MKKNNYDESYLNEEEMITTNNPNEDVLEETPSIKDDKKIIEKSSTEVKTNGPETMNGIIVNSLHVKLRKEPNRDSEVIGVIDSGEKVVVLSKRGEFYEISTSGIPLAYVLEDYVIVYKN